MLNIFPPLVGGLLHKPQKGVRSSERERKQSKSHTVGSAKAKTNERKREKMIHLQEHRKKYMIQLFRTHLRWDLLVRGDHSAGEVSDGGEHLSIVNKSGKMLTRPLRKFCRDDWSPVFMTLVLSGDHFFLRFTKFSTQRPNRNDRRASAGCTGASFTDKLVRIR